MELPADVAQLLARLREPCGPVGRLHCLYVAPDETPDSARLHPYWAGDRMTRWQLKVLTQAELASVGLAFHGPWPPPAITPVPTAVLRTAVHQEISGYWRRIARQRMCWLQDTWVGFGLTVLPRTEALLTTGDLITKV